MTPDPHTLTTRRAAETWRRHTNSLYSLDVLAALRDAYDAGFQDARDTLDPIRALPVGTVIRDAEADDGDEATAAVITGGVARGDWRYCPSPSIGRITAYTTDDQTRRYTRNADGTWTYRDLTGDNA